VPSPVYKKIGKLVVKFNIKRRVTLSQCFILRSEKLLILELLGNTKSGVITREAPMGEVCSNNLECCLGQRMNY
jgi:hypothetical protein